MMKKKENTPEREWKRKYEERHKEERKARNGQFSTFIPRTEFEEINEFLKTHKLKKVDLVRVGYKVLKAETEQKGTEGDHGE